MRKVGDRVQSSVIDTSSQTEKLLSERACRERLHEMIEYPKALPQYIPCWRFFFCSSSAQNALICTHNKVFGTEFILRLDCKSINLMLFRCFKMILKKKHLKNFDLMFFQSKHTCKSTHTTLPNTTVAMIVPSTFSSFLRYSSAPSALVALLPMKMN